jgi:hypothetical protein
MTDLNEFEGEELDCDIYEDEPDYDGPVVLEDDSQDDDTDVPLGLGFMARATNAVHTWRETLQWYKENQHKSQIGFDPDGMCLKVVRTARNISAKYLTAKEAQDNTPKEHRIHKVRDLRRGMIAYFDDPNDSNRAGHVVTQIGRVKGFDPDEIRDVLFETNDVKSGELVIVRGDYFLRYWGDEFKFGATWLNGVEFDTPVPKKEEDTRVENFHQTKPKYDLTILARAGKNRPAVKSTHERILGQCRQLPDHPSLTKVREFKDKVRRENVLDLRILDQAVKNGLTGKVKRIRDEVRRLINELPEE